MEDTLDSLPVADLLYSIFLLHTFLLLSDSAAVCGVRPKCFILL